jgi:hypothetical protein
METRLMMMIELFYIRDLQSKENLALEQNGRKEIYCMPSMSLLQFIDVRAASLQTWPPPGYCPSRLEHESRNRANPDINKIRPRGLMAKALDFGPQQLIPLEIPGSTPGVVD